MAHRPGRIGTARIGSSPRDRRAERLSASQDAPEQPKRSARCHFRCHPARFRRTASGFLCEKSPCELAFSLKRTTGVEPATFGLGTPLGASAESGRVGVSALERGFGLPRVARPMPTGRSRCSPGVLTPRAPRQANAAWSLPLERLELQPPELTGALRRRQEINPWVQGPGLLRRDHLHRVRSRYRPQRHRHLG